MPFDQALQVNPSVPLQRGVVYPFVEMQAVDPGSHSVGPSEMREFSGGGSRFIAGDTLMARITPCLENGKIARFVMKGEQQMGHGSTEFIVIRGRPRVTDNDFVYYLTKWDGVRLYCISQMTGSSGRQRVPTGALSHCEVTIPPVKEQQAIAHILGTLDDKIELNRRTNETLEDIARALFKSWFVDFDPVRAKADGRQPEGLDADTAALFPDFFEDSPLGKIPRGWEIRSFDQLVEIWSGGTPKTSIDAYWNGDIPWFTVTDAPSESDIFVIDTGKYITQAGVDNSATRLLPVGTTIISARGTVGKLAMVGRPMAMNQTCYGLKGKKGYPDPFIYFQTKALVEELKQRTHGCVFDTIIRDTFKMLEVVSPPTNLAEAFGARVEPILQKIYCNLLESRTLAVMRDALLPKLLSGEVRVEDTKK